MENGNTVRLYTAAEISTYIKLSSNNVRIRIKKDQIPKEGTKLVEHNDAAAYLFDTLPPEWQEKIDQAEYEQDQAKRRAEQNERLKALGLEPCEGQPLFEREEREKDMVAYAKASENNRALCDKYLYIENEAGHLKGRALAEWLKNVWNPQNPGQEVQYRTVMENRKKLREAGKAALIGRRGAKAGWTKIKPEWQEYFDSLYLKEGGPSMAACWRAVVGRFCQGGDIAGFPTDRAFLNQLRKKRGESAIYLQRRGYSKWDRKYGRYVDRDYSQLRPNECWVSDHAQLDIMVINPETGKPCCAWVTSFIDMSTDKVLSSYYHCDAPNSDHIFQAFQIAVERYGLPECIYIDNGKDYRCKDFAGGKPTIGSHKIKVDEKRATSMLAMLGVKVVFAAPYNAKAKTIERYHLRIKTDFSIFLPGYRGGNVTERPEQLAKDTKAGKLLVFDVVKDAYYQWVEDVYNRMPSDGKKLQGQSPNDAWNLVNPIKRTISAEALALFCMRSSKVYTIGRNGIADSKNNITYWAEWMTARNGEKVVLRRNPQNLNRAWVMSPDNENFLGIATIAGLVPALAQDEIGKKAVSEAIATQKSVRKAVEALGTVAHVPDVTSIINDKAVAAGVLNPDVVPEPDRTVSMILPNNPMQRVVNQAKKQERDEQAAAEGVTQHALSSELRLLKTQRARLVEKNVDTYVDAEIKNAQIAQLDGRIEQLMCAQNQ